MSGTVLDGDGTSRRKRIAAAPAPDVAKVAPVAAQPSVDDFIASMSEEQRKELARKLLGL